MRTKEQITSLSGRNYVRTSEPITSFVSVSTGGICEHSGKRGAHAAMAFVGFCCMSKRRVSHVLFD